MEVDIDARAGQEHRCVRYVCDDDGHMSARRCNGDVEAANVTEAGVFETVQWCGDDGAVIRCWLLPCGLASLRM